MNISLHCAIFLSVGAIGEFSLSHDEEGLVDVEVKLKSGGIGVRLKREVGVDGELADHTHTHVLRPF